MHRCMPRAGPRALCRACAPRGEIPISRGTTRICGKPERRSSGPTSSRDEGSRTSRVRSWLKIRRAHPGAHANRATGRRDRRHAVDLARQPQPREGQHGVVRRRSAGRKDSAADAGGAGSPGRARRGAQAKRPRAGRLLHRSQPVRPLHLARCPWLDDARHLRQLVRDRAGTRASSSFATR